MTAASATDLRRADLRQEAVGRLDELRRDRGRRDDEDLVHAVMTDDGG